MATLDKAWTKSLAEEVLGEENARNEDVDAFHESDKSQILDKASRGRSLVATKIPSEQRTTTRTPLLD